MAGLWVRVLSTAATSLTAMVLGLFSPRILATIVVLSTEKLVKKTKWEWDDKLLEKIKEEWRV